MNKPARYNLVLKLLRCEFRSCLKSTRRYDLIWILFGGSALLTYAMLDIILFLYGHAETIRNLSCSASICLVMIATFSGVAIGIGVSNLTGSRASAPFLKALPLSPTRRHQIALGAALALGIPSNGLLALLFCILWFFVVRAKTLTLPISLCVGLGIGFAVATLSRLQFVVHRDKSPQDPNSTAHNREHRFPLLRKLDRPGLAWFGAWARNTQGGHARFTFATSTAVLVPAILAVLSMGISNVRHQTVPATICAIASGIVAFMFTLRCHPLRSPLLRTSPLSFTRAWLRLLRLPLVFSGIFFVIPAGVALATEPSGWMVPFSGGLGLLLLNAVYGVFAAYFLSSPLLAVVSFAAALLYCNYESLEYGRAAFFGLAALIAWLWHQARKWYYHE